MDGWFCIEQEPRPRGHKRELKTLERFVPRTSP